MLADIFGSGAPVLLLVSTDDEGRKRDAASDIQGANALGSVKLVTRNSQSDRPDCPSLSAESSRRLHRVHMKRYAPCFDDLADLVDGKNHTRFIVRSHNRYQSSIVGQCIAAAPPDRAFRPD